MNIYKLFRWQKEHAVSVPKEPDVQIQPAKAVPWNPKYVRDMTLEGLLNATGRSNKRMPGNGHSNCAFNAILEQVGDRTRNSEMVNLLREKLGYDDESSNKGFDIGSCLAVSDIFKHPVIEIYHNCGKVTDVIVSMLSIGLRIIIKSHQLLSQNFAAWYLNYEQKQNVVDDISQWLQAEFPGFDFGNATLGDVLLQLLRCPTAISLVSLAAGGHFDAAPHKDLKSTDNVLELLRGAKSYRLVEDSTSDSISVG